MQSFLRPLGFRVRLLAAALVVCSASMALAERVEDLPKPTDYVSDFAHVLSPDAVARIDALCSELDHSAANAQIAVVTVHNLDGDDAADWANRLEDAWHPAKKGTDRGVLILLAVDDRKYRIDVAYGLEGILPDGKVGDIGREMRVYLRQSDYNDAVLLAVGEVGQVIAQDAHVDLSEQAQPMVQQPGNRVHRGSPFGGLILLVLLMFFFGGSWIFRLLFGWGLLSSIIGGRGPWMGGGWGGGSWGSGGGWGGGGGGGGGFGGFGGGSFGGGGAGGSW